MIISNDNFKQLEAKKIGESGCYFLSIIHGCQNYALEHLNKTIAVDIIKVYEIANKEKWMNCDCYIERPDLLAGYILGVDIDILRKAYNKESEIKQIKIYKKDLNYTPASNEIEITRYELKETGKTYAHFVETRNSNIIYDPYGTSKTVNKGIAQSKRIITVNL